jgi:hypothetical protein
MEMVQVGLLVSTPIFAIPIIFVATYVILRKVRKDNL